MHLTHPSLYLRKLYATCIISKLFNSVPVEDQSILHLPFVMAVSVASLSNRWTNEYVPSVSSTLGRGLGEKVSSVSWRSKAEYWILVAGSDCYIVCYLVVSLIGMNGFQAWPLASWGCISVAVISNTKLDILYCSSGASPVRWMILPRYWALPAAN